MQFMKRHSLSIAVLVFFVFALCGPVYAQRPKQRPKAPRPRLTIVGTTDAAATLSPDQLKRSATFLQAWQTLNDNYFIIPSVEKGSGATMAGLRPGYILEKINGVALSDLTAQLLAAYPNIRHLERYLPIQIIGSFLNGERDTFVFLTCVDENDQPREFKVPRLTLGGQNVIIGQRFPIQFLQFQ